MNDSIYGDKLMETRIKIMPSQYCEELLQNTDLNFQRNQDLCAGKLNKNKHRYGFEKYSFFQIFIPKEL